MLKISNTETYLLWFIGISHLILVLLFTITLIFYLFPERLVDGTYISLVITIATFVASKSTSLRLVLFEFFPKAVLHIIRHLRYYFIWSLNLSLFCSLWVFYMYKPFIERFQYIYIIKDATKVSNLDMIILPDPGQLAKAFFLFPNRREAAFLLTRASRIFHYGNNEIQFARYQEEFINEIRRLGEDNLIERIINALKSGENGLNGLHFYARVNTEAYGIPRDETQNSINTSIEEVNKSILWLSSAPSVKLSSGIIVDDFEAKIIKTTLDYLISDLKKESMSSVWKKTEKLKQELETLNHEALANIYQSHAFFEFLDLRSFLIIEGIKNGESYASDDILLKEIFENYKKILMLRSALAHSGQIQWIVSPTKLTLFHLFMLQGGSFTTVSKKQQGLLGLDPVNPINKATNEALEVFLSTKFSQSFKEPNTWYISTPLDPNLNGVQLITKINEWLKTGW